MPISTRRITIGSETIEYTLRSGRRLRRLCLSVYRDGRVALSAPLRLSQKRIEAFLSAQAHWILAKREHLLGLPPVVVRPDNRPEYLANKARAHDLITQRLQHFNSLYGFRFNKISIRNQKTRWGSCSAKANLNFNYKIVFLAPRLADYIIVHELCHLKEMNHSRRFWDLVSLAISDYSDLRNDLKRSGLNIS